MTMEAPLQEVQGVEGNAESEAQVGEGPTPKRSRPKPVPAPKPAPKLRVRGPGLQAKIILLMVVSLAVLALISAFATSTALQARMIAEAGSKGEAIAQGLASSAAPLLAAGDSRTLEALVGSFEQIAGVTYLVVYDRSGRPVASSYPGSLPEPLAGAPPAEPGARRTVMVTEPGGTLQTSVLDLGRPIAGGGAVRVGMNQDAILEQVRGLNLNLLVIQAMVALVAVLFTVMFSARLVRPIRALVKVAGSVGRGDLSRTVRAASTDEVGLLARTFNDSIKRLRGLVVTEAERDEERRRREALQDNIRGFLQVTREIAQGDLRRRGEVTEDVLGNVVDSINLMVEEIASTLQGVREAADTVSANADQVIRATDEIGVSVESQLASARRVAESVAEVTGSVRGVSERAEASSGAARQTLEAARTGQQAVGDSLDSMQRIRGEVQGISRRIKGLGDRSLEISEIVDPLSGISSQTNLLALNAAIEASGAGEQGARFAVVADEVRKLAEASAASSKRIAGLIKTVQAEILDAVGAMETGTVEVETGFRLAQQAGERLERIAEISSTSAELAQQISGQTAGQVESIEQVAATVKAIADLALQTDQTVAGGRQTAEQLRELAVRLNQRLARFELPAAS
jgi:methyl-accepting chemotaxis protein